MAGSLGLIKVFACEGSINQLCSFLALRMFVKLKIFFNDTGKLNFIYHNQVSFNIHYTVFISKKLTLLSCCRNFQVLSLKHRSLLNVSKTKMSYQYLMTLLKVSVWFVEICEFSVPFLLGFPKLPTHLIG